MASILRAVFRSSSTQAWGVLTHFVYRFARFVSCRCSRLFASLISYPSPWGACGGRRGRYSVSLRGGLAVPARFYFAFSGRFYLGRYPWLGLLFALSVCGRDWCAVFVSSFFGIIPWRGRLVLRLVPLVSSLSLVIRSLPSSLLAVVSCSPCASSRPFVSCGGSFSSVLWASWCSFLSAVSSCRLVRHAVCRIDGCLVGCGSCSRFVFFFSSRPWCNFVVASCSFVSVCCVSSGGVSFSLVSSGEGGFSIIIWRYGEDAPFSQARFFR